MQGVTLSFIIILGGYLCSCETVTNSPCSDLNPCIQGFACSPEGVCVAAQALSITTEQLGAAYQQKAYSVQIDALGGIEPYAFSLETDQSWLSIGAATGTISGTPSGIASGAKVEVFVTDSSFGNGMTVSREFVLDVFECIEDAQETCFRAESGRCTQGQKSCSNHQWSECAGSSPSADFLHCGPQCFPCASGLANHCQDGMCFCGIEEACGVDRRCCQTDSAFECVDPLSHPSHCGSCQTDCMLTVHQVNQILCTDGTCNFDSCVGGFLDCDHQGKNGCESAFDDQNCGACGVNCAQEVQNASDPHCTQAGSCAYGECYPGSLDCDQITHNGCEAKEDEPKNCGGCENNCAERAEGPRCLWDPSQGYFCGCQDESDCDLNQSEQCCDSVCVPNNDPAHCGSCGLSCLINPDGQVCLNPQTGRCGCLKGESAEGVGCPSNSLCCGPDQESGACLQEDDQNCATCGLPCSPSRGGPRCNPPNERCECLNLTECRDWPLDAEHCVAIGSSSDPYSQCRCGESPSDPICEGSPDSRCCESGSGHACIDTNTNNLHCGRCTHPCGVNTNGTRVACSSGRCQCNLNDPELPKADCPGNGPGPDCVGYTCRCLAFGGGTLPCPQGRTCCHGDQGGSGGQAGAADTGCCTNLCGENQEGECIFE